MRPYIRFGITMMLLSTLMACAAPRSEWTSVPEIALYSAEKLDIRVKPLKLDKPYFTVFELTVHNKTTIPLEINWNESQFVYGKKELGIFVFTGITPEDIKNKTIANEVIAPGDTMVKQIVPAHTVAWTPLRLAGNADESSFSPGVLPKGTNRISLRFLQNSRTWRQILSVKIIESKMPSSP